MPKPIEKPQIKKVKIDDHIKNSRKPENAPKRKAGRPPGSGKKSITPRAEPSTSGTPQPLHSPTPDNGNNISAQPARVEPQYDTTEEAKAFIQAPFQMAAGLTGNKKYELSENQVLAIAPSWKVVYDRRIKPSLGENADIWAFATVFAGVAFEKVMVVREDMAKKQKSKIEERYAVSEPVKTPEPPKPVESPKPEMPKLPEIKIL